MSDIHKRSADNIRALSAAMVEKANSGHPGGPMGGADFSHILYTEYMRFDPENMHWPWRDRFFQDAGHLSAMMYAQMHLFGKYSKDDIMNFRQWESVTPGHPEIDVDRGIENTSGPLGQGHVMGVGAAIAAKFLQARFGDWTDHTIYAYITDGGIQEEASQGAGRIAGFLGLSNLVMFFDSNDVQLSSNTEDVTSEDTAKKYEAWGWRVKTIDGHDHDAIRQALDEAREETEKPFLIIGKTIMGKGAVAEDGSSYEGSYDMHGMPLGKTGADFAKTLEALGSDPENPFKIFEDVQAHYEGVIEKLRKHVGERKAEEEKWRSANQELSEKLDLFLSGEIRDIDFSAVEQKPDVATRAASSTVLSFLSGKVENMIVASADLSNSDKTDGWLKKTTAFKKGDFSGNFLQAGVAELTMAGIANGLALHGGVIPAVATFFVFSDFMKPAIRLAAIQQLPVKYIWTHDAFRVGEDGPTHQPIEQETQIRLLEKTRNHSGFNSMLVLRPADDAETTVTWKMALENTEVPTGMIFSRQNIKSIPSQNGSRFNDALNSAKGAYLVRKTDDPDVILVGNGSEVSTLIAGADLLEKEGVKANVVSAISEGLFRLQSPEYQESVIPSDKPVFGLTAGLPQNLLELVGPYGTVYGLDHFGYSAPAGVLDEKFGYTGDTVCAEVRAYLEEINESI
jgi:transketolase